MNTTLTPPRIVSPAEWLAARQQHLVREKQLTRELDELYAQRRRLPWTRVEKRYVFDSPAGKKTLAELFAGRSQLFIYHFMFGPDWDEGCKSCSLIADHIDGPRQHLEQHDVTFLAVSRAPLARIEEFKRRMSWKFPWVSSHANDFNYDFHVSFKPGEMAPGKAYYNWAFSPETPPVEELPGASIFVRGGSGEVYHTYSAYARGLDVLLGVHHMLDFTPKGRDEHEGPMDWVRHHDRYGAAS
ncbi:MAG: DUF899 domain-containing protein [Opitutae bacterium]|nr:DUF899 domain-containing protein [Opitutae bacterium]